MRSSKKLKAIGKFALDTNAVIAYREGISEVCKLIDDAEVILLPVTVIGELLYGALNSKKPGTMKSLYTNLSGILL
jgi:predicted nucleic acid-binding protein